MVDVVKKDEYIYELPQVDSMHVPGRIFASPELLAGIMNDSLTFNQIANVASLPGILDASIAMPDAHRGYGFCIGGVAAFDSKNGVVSPGGVGYDINCGVRLLATNIRKEDFLKVREEIGSALDSRIPSGVGGEHGVPLTREEMDQVLTQGMKYLVNNGLAEEQDLDAVEEGGCVEGADILKVSARARSRGEKQLGTLGAGNHFLEFQVVDEYFDEALAKKWGLERGTMCIMIHCGSRGLGHQIASDYIVKMEKKFGTDTLPDRELACAPLGSDLANDYFGAMNCAVNFAFANRGLIMYYVREVLSEFFPSHVNRLVYDVAHNIAKFEEHFVASKGKAEEVCIHRKGATRAFAGQPVILPGSMGTASYVLVGTEAAMKLSFGSTAHGAGRVMSRSKANAELSVDSVVASVEKAGAKIKSRSTKGIVSEAPQVYKDINEVARVSDEAGIATRVVCMKPLLVIKG